MSGRVDPPDAVTAAHAPSTPEVTGETRHGTLLFAHGARDPRWALPFEAVRDRLAALQPSGAVALAYLEFMSPSLAEAGAALAEAGCGRVTIVPLFLGAGGHVRKDLPALVDQLSVRYPAVQWALVRAVGESALVVEAMAQAALAAGLDAATRSRDPEPGTQA